MSINRCIKECYSQIQELRALVSEEDFYLLAEERLKLGEDVFDKWRADNCDEIADYVRATPSARLKKKRWQDPHQRRTLAYWAIQHIGSAVFLLEELNNNLQVPGLPYRETAATAGSVFYRICHHKNCCNEEIL